MTASRIERMRVLIEMAQVEVDQTLGTYQMIQSQLASHIEQLNSLKTYQSDYIQSMTRADIPLLPVQLQTTQAFLDKLNKAVVAQKSQVLQLEDAEEQARQQWQEKRIRLDALEKLRKKLQLKESTRLNKLEQNMLDELSVQRFSSIQAERNKH